MANYLRLAPETVSRVLRRFQTEGLIQVERRDHVRVTDAHLDLRLPSEPGDLGGV